ncbi:hypothetical protein T07_9828 [Trichinella nelsoni]|uniref:Uncharacterized protein n=1 Tax=Trichinella nelsoni TaxID=6336 RepID=A0A0V0SMB0_9BILA|nr:hypothetical protein T07_9828 [Trichinella nelsoni]
MIVLMHFYICDPGFWLRYALAVLEMCSDHTADRCYNGLDDLLSSSHSRHIYQESVPTFPCARRGQCCTLKSSFTRSSNHRKTAFWLFEVSKPP